MKRLLILIIVASVGWSAYWFIGATGVKTGFSRWFESRQSEGWLAEYDDLSVKGFPNRFDTTFTSLSLADPDTGVAWTLPFFQLFSLSYKPHHIIAVWPHTQTVAYPDQKIDVSSTDMRASLVVGASTLLPLERSNLVIQGLSVTSSADWQFKADNILLAAHHEPDTEATYRIALQADHIVPPVGIRLGTDSNLPNALSTIKADIIASFEQPWNRHAVEVARPQPTSIDVRLAKMAWGDLDLQAAGKVSIDNDGIPTGDITIRATNWRQIIQVARGSGQIPASVLDGVEQGLSLLAGISGNPKTLDIPLEFGNGMTRLGPIPIGPAPRLRLR